MASSVEWGAVGGKDKKGMLGAQSLYVLERGVKGNCWLLDFVLIELTFSPRRDSLSENY